MFDLIFHKGRAVAHINLGSIFSEQTNEIIGTLSGGKIFSTNGRMLGSFKSASDPSPDKALSSAFCSVLNISA